MKPSTRQASDGDFEFLFELKKAAEFESVRAVFGCDEEIQRQIHRNEWREARPTIIEVNGKAVGSFLLQEKSDHLYFCRFFLLPEYQGKGIGHKVLEQSLEFANNQNQLGCVP